jgi:group I intron endonuclease
MKKIGIYKITNPKGAIYIGESNDINRRWDKEYMNLKCKQQRKLYNSFVKYGVENHTFEIVKECTIEEIPYYERHYQEFCNVLDREFGLNLKYRKTFEKKEVKSTSTIEKQKKTLAKKYAEGYMSLLKGRKHTQDQIEKNRQAQLKYASLDTYKNARKGAVASDDTRKKMSANNARAQMVFNLQTGMFYDSVKLAFESQEGVKKYSYFVGMVNGSFKNKTNFKYA